MQKIALALAAALVGGAAQAQSLDNFAIEYGVSTLGAYVAPEYSHTDNLRFRLPIYGFSYSDTFDLDGNEGEGSLDVRSVALLADYYFWGNGLRVSGGLAFGGYDLSMNVTDPEFDGNIYTGSGAISLTQDNDVNPVLAVGYQHRFGSNFALSAELGARIGTLKFDADQSFISSDPTVNLDEDIARINEDLNDIPAIPFLSLGFTWRF